MGKVAILAVHGIGQHSAGETQDAVADLLMSLPARGPWGDARRYDAFKCVGLEIPLQPVPKLPVPPGGTPAPASPGGVAVPAAPVTVPPAPGGAVKPKTRWRDTYREESEDFAAEITQAAPLKVGDTGVRYTDRLLRQYKGGADGNVYKTNRLEGERLADKRKVDIYEVLWADLAKPDNSVVAFFLYLFQLIIHLGSLSRLAVDSGAGEGKDWRWRTFRVLQRYAVRMLQLFIPLLEVVLLVDVASCLPRVLAGPGSLAVPVVLGILGGVGIGIVVVHVLKPRITMGPWAWSSLALLPIVLGASLPLLAMHCIFPSWQMTVKEDIGGGVLFWLFGGVALLYWILSKYEDTRKGAALTGWVLGVAGLACYGRLTFCAYKLLLSHKSDLSYVSLLATLWTAELILGVTRLCWALMIVFAIAASAMGSWAWRSVKRANPAGDEWGRARAAVRTSRLAMALPAVLFMLVTLVIWAGVVKGIDEVRPNKDTPSVFNELAFEEPPSWFGWLQEKQILPPPELTNCDLRYYCDAQKKEDGRTTNYAMRVLAWSMGYQLPVVLAVLGLTAFLLLWWALPSVFTEAKVRRGVDEPPRDTTDAVSMGMGTWMSRGLDATAVVTMLLWISMFVISPAYLIANYIWKVGDTLGPITYNILSYPVVGFGLLALLAARGRTVLSTILDVDTYLRTSPITATPRATIFERYVSTLRYLQNYQDENGDPYERIVIFAHSLGALISGDLLLYLHTKGLLDPVPRVPPIAPVPSIPIRLMTFGNPTRQLLNRFFPYLYDWVRAVPDHGKEPLGQPMQTPPITIAIADTALPDPKDLGLQRWVSAYRSADYVGRSLWLNEWYHRPAYAPNKTLATVFKSLDGTRQEMCIGAGAHTRYMDDTAPDMAFVLDSLLDP